MAAMAVESSSESGPGIEENSEGAVNLLQSLIDNLDNVLPLGILGDVRAAPKVPPVSKQDEHNSCLICRHELQTDDHVYKNWKEREKEAEED
ncbi:hypothetical protein DVH24_020306 [Malus domestica]|uniref:Uncharacterized protein n=1 Tax=Malus domestica TaxID=3750 RepID=A0A498JBV5_MALDO|nr:hypothetical protein DVH24_020306 [Malus domestica]